MTASYSVPVYRIALVREGRALKAREPATNPKEIATLVARHLRGADREHFVCVMLDSRSRVLGLNTVSVGTVSMSLVHPRETFKAAILAGAAAVVVAHNHPSGDIDPSKEDRESMGRLVQAGRILGIEVLDWLVVASGGNYWSAKEQGQL